MSKKIVKHIERTKQKGEVEQKIKQRKIVIASSIGLLIITGIFIAIMIINLYELQINKSKLNLSINDTYENQSIINGKDHSNNSNYKENDNDSDVLLSKNSSNITTSSDSIKTNESLSQIQPDSKGGIEENSIYIPLQIEPAKTTEIISATTNFFKERIPFLQQVLKDSGFFYSEKLLDPNTMTKVYILAKNKNCAENLNGYFYYLFDEKGSSTIVSPFVLNISLLFDEENRGTVIESRTFAETRHLQELKKSMIAILGVNYSEEVFNFIFSEYKRTFADRIDGKPLQNPVCKLQLKNLEVVFHNSFLTYIEFFINQ